MRTKIERLPADLKGWTAERITQELDDRRKLVGEIFAEAGDDMDLSRVTVIDGDSTAKVAELKRLNDEIDKIGKHPLPHPGHPVPRGGWKNAPAARGRTEGAWAKALRSDPKYREIRQRGLKGLGSVTLPALLSNEIVGQGQEPTNVLQLIPAMALNGNTDRFAFLRQSVRTNNAAAVALGGVKPESVISLEKVEEAVTTVATVSEPIDNAHLADFPNVVSFLDQELRFYIMEEIEDQVLNGNGTAPNLRGILNTTGIQTQAKGADPTPDAVLKALDKVRTGTSKEEPDAVVFHVNDWQEVALLRTADGTYIWGDPSGTGPRRIWGLPVVLTTRIPQGTALVGAFARGAMLWERQGVTLDSTDSGKDGTNDLFVVNKQRYRAEARVGLAVERPTAFCTVTGV